MSAFVVDSLPFGDAEEDGGKNAGAAGGRGRDDDSHRGVDLLHGQRAGEDVAEECVGERPVGTGAQLGGVAADEPGRRAQVAGEPLPHGAPHHLECPRERRANVGDRAPLIARLGGERDVRERRTGALGVADGVG